MAHDKKIKNCSSLFLVAIVFLFCFNVQTSFAKEYYYQDFEADIKINQDSSFDVTEKQTYYLDGNFGFFNRDVSLNKIDAITDVEVFDGNNNKIPKNELDIKSVSGVKHIQWNFPRRDFYQEEKSWTIKYKVHGGISFLKNYDEIYWNAVPQKRDVAIQNVKVTISLPNNEKFRSDLIRLYAEGFMNPLREYSGDKDYFYTVTSVSGYYFNQDNTEAIFWGKNIKPNTNFTVAVGFSKGIVSQDAYFRDFLFMYYGYILSIIIFLSCVIIGFIHWYKTEKSREGKRAIVPQYEPPQNLRPAMAEVIIKEKLTDKGLAATIIDLAVRGYVRIEEEKKGKWEEFLSSAGSIIPMFILFSPFVIILFLLWFLSEDRIMFYNLLFIIIILLLISTKLFRSIGGKKSGDYLVRKIKSYENDPNLEKYEEKYLNALFGSKDYFSTKEIKKDSTKSSELYLKIEIIKDEVYKEIELDTKAFKVGMGKEKYIGATLGAIVFTAFIIISVSGGIFTEFIQPLTIAIAIIGSIIGLYAFIKYEARLSNEGIKLKEDLLGFKMYLETAEKYRMQNLKPEYFEKYLPYAMIFRVEKKWAKAFESLNISSPSWYVGSAYATGVSSNSVGSFSPSAFSASFTSSFSSAFASSGASGASGGGGGAGGGGGGGGGGAG